MTAAFFGAVEDDSPTCATCHAAVRVDDACEWENGIEVCNRCAQTEVHRGRKRIAELELETKALRSLLWRQWDGCEPHTPDGAAAQAETYKLIKRWNDERRGAAPAGGEST